MGNLIDGRAIAERVYVDLRGEIAQLRSKGVTPGLAVVLPTQPGPTLLVDAGAIADPKPEMLVAFAQLGVAYAQVAHGSVHPDPWGILARRTLGVEWCGR